MGIDDQTYKKIHLTCELILCGVVITIALIYTKPVLVPFIFAIFYYVMSLPIVHFFERKLKVPRIVAVFLTVSAATLVTGAILLMLTVSVESFVSQIDQYKNNFLEIADWTASTALQFGYDLNPDALKHSLLTLPLFKIASGFAGTALGLLGDVFLTILIYMFLITGGSNDSKKSSLWIELESKISTYVILKTLISAATGVMVGVLFAAFGVELAVSFGIITFLLNFIPNIGSVVAFLLPLPVLILQFGLSWYLWMILGLSLFLQFVVGNIIEPKLVGGDMDLHPVTVLLFLIFWGLVWGLPGMFLAVPITALVKIVLAKIKPTHRLSEILAGRLG